RKVNEKLVNAPGGAVNVDTSYDLVGRIQSVSHAYRTTSDPSHVFETMAYDGLSRKISTTHPDAQSSREAYGTGVAALAGVTTQQSAASTYGYGYPVLTVDEAGNQRQRWIDGFGQIIEVDEPTASSGMPGSGTITVAGSERSKFFPAGCSPRWDGGFLIVTVNGTQVANMAWGAGGGNSCTAPSPMPTAVSLASQIAATINTSSFVHASVSGPVITITSNATGANTNYSLSTQVISTFVQAGLPAASFSLTPSGSSLTGGTGGQGISSSPIFTGYTYDVAGNLVTVAQGVQTRTFAYDGLGRATLRTTPEGGTDTFYYTRADGVSLCAGSAKAVCRRTDARGITTTYAYDSLSRLIGKTYSNGQGAIAYQYDQGGVAAFALGRLTTLTDPSGSETYTYNPMGWVTQIQKTIGTTPFTVGYQYNTTGQVTQITYPSNRVVQQNVDNIGLLNSVVSGGTTYASIPEPPTGYDPAGHLLTFTYANGVVASFAYSPTRDQMTNLSYTKSAQTLFGLSYGYSKGQANCDNTTVTGNDGVIQCIQDTVDNGRSVVYQYDALGRLGTTVTTGSVGYGKWGLSWVYDRYGNRLNQTLTAGRRPSNSLS